MLLAVSKLCGPVLVKNISLNPGGFVGAVLMIAAVIIAVVLTSSTNNIGGRIGGFGVPALFLGAFGGNYIWDRLFSNRK
jgi:hypothetical protein